MGGRSTSRVEFTLEGALRFSGNVSFENSGGFASVRTDVQAIDLSGYTGLSLRVIGDGKRYKLSLRHTDDGNAIQYQAALATNSDLETQLWIPFNSFEPRYRGRVVASAPQLDISRIRIIGLLIADQQAGPFELSWLSCEAR